MKRRIDSQNFLTSLITVFVAIGGYNQIDLDIDATQTASAILAKNWEYLLQVAGPTLVNFTLKVTKAIQDKTFTFKGLLKSPNALTALISLAAVIITGLGVILDPIMPQALTQAFFEGSVVSIVTALITYLVNPLYHFIKDLVEKKEQP